MQVAVFAVLKRDLWTRTVTMVSSLGTPHVLHNK